MAELTLRRLLHASLLSLCLGAGCGTLSNEDLQFIAVLPDESLTLALPPTTPGSTRSSEFGVVAGALTTSGRLNLVARTIVNHAQAISGHSATERGGGHRVWGPFALPDYPGYGRLIMDRDPGVACDVPGAPLEKMAAGYRWSVEISSAKNGPYNPLTTGTVRGLDFSHSCGTVAFDSVVSRAFGGPETDDDPRATRLRWTRTQGVTTIGATVDPSPSAASALVENQTYDFKTTSSLYGHFSFAARYHPTAHPDQTHISLSTLQWGPNGQPWRADYDTEDDADRALLTHGIACGSRFGSESFVSEGVEPKDPAEALGDENCSFDFSSAR